MRVRRGEPLNVAEFSDLMKSLCVQVKRLPHAEGLPLPTVATSASVGFDLQAAVERYVHCFVNKVTRIPTGLCVEIPAGYVGLVFSRSGLATKHQISVANGVGVVDPDYRGEIFVCLENRGESTFIVKRGDRLAQLVIVPVPAVTLIEVEELSDTERGEKGFGSTGY